MSSAEIKKSRRILLWVLAAFIIPVVLAKLALEQHWFNYGVTNKGRLLANEITLTKMGLTQEALTHKWLMIYLLPDVCDPQCEKTMHSVNNTFIALGEDMQRVIPVALTSAELSASQYGQIKTQYWQVLTTPELTKPLFSTQQVLIVDTLGNVILSHTPPLTETELPQFGKALLTDLKKLLKYSRIG